MCISPTQKLDRQMDELLKEEQAVRNRKIARSDAMRMSLSPETSDLIKSILKSRNFFDEKFPEEESIPLDMSPDPVIEDKFSAKTVSTSKNNFCTRIVQNDQPVDLNRPANIPFIYFADPAVKIQVFFSCVCVCVCVFVR